MAVSSKKDKLIEEAQKFMLRGQFDKAAASYEQVVASEPSAINHRQKLAELLIKCGRNDSARKEFEIIGTQFSKGGFYLKAIAVYKQLQKIFPEDISLSLTLAELNEKHGLIANALEEYKLVYGFHEKGGNIPEALNILNKMQNVDPQNIPIKIKLAEGYFQQDRKADSYTLFSKIVSLVIERNDSMMLSKISSRILQLFPDKPDFMIEVISEQIQLGNAASTIDSIQTLLRNNPKNKVLWNLIVQAYQKLEQPQKVKLAFQNYLKFFPSEPAAMFGIISSVTAEQNLEAALELLDLYEAGLIQAGFFQELDQVYHALDKIDPINIRVLEGLIRVATASGNEKVIRPLTSRLQSLQSAAADGQTDDIELELSAGVFGEQTAEADETGESPVSVESAFEQETLSVIELPDLEESVESASEDRPFGAVSITDEIQELEPSFSDESAFEQEGPSAFESFDIELSPEDGSSDVESITDEARMFEEEIEIDLDIDLDLDTSFGPEDQETISASSIDDELGSLDDLFGSINTAPRSVKFGNEMDTSDMQSHFDLGQAFKEMGLYDEAINEFRQASQDPSRRVECLIMQCACLRERGELDKAISMLQTLLKPGLREEESCAIKYELATGYEFAGKREEANILLNEIHSANPGFRDIGVRLNAANVSESLDFSDDDLKDF